MAIIVEEERPQINITRMLMWLIILVIIGVAIYYIFFSQPQIVDVAIPSNFQNIDPLASINLNPEDVINGPEFQALKQYVTVPEPGNAGRLNPFSAP
ncbi:MAG: hypothetical protein AAB897_04080 [Patescibacteria group bacterium]